MNNNILMLLPFLMGQNNNSMPMELVTKMILNNNTNMNPMMLMMLSMMNNKNKSPVNENKEDIVSKNEDISSIFGGDVASMLKLFMEFSSNANNKKDNG